MSQQSFYAGVDIGSAFTKIVIVDQNKNICGSSIDYSGIDLLSTAVKSLRAALPVNKEYSEIKKIVTTGFGRKSVIFPQIPSTNLTEISCSANASQFIYPNETLTIVDIGGQDTKIIKMQNGKRISFKMNRKCAAGTGTFLEELALKLRIKLEDLNTLASQSVKPEHISSYCTVFASTEILTRIREGAKAEDMIRGAFYSIVKRVLEIDVIDSKVILTGGVVAHNPIIIEIFKENLDIPVLVPPSPQIFVALGAALYASSSNA